MVLMANLFRGCPLALSAQAVSGGGGLVPHSTLNCFRSEKGTGFGLFIIAAIRLSCSLHRIRVMVNDRK